MNASTIILVTQHMQDVSMSQALTNAFVRRGLSVLATINVMVSTGTFDHVLYFPATARSWPLNAVLCFSIFNFVIWRFSRAMHGS